MDSLAHLLEEAADALHSGDGYMVPSDIAKALGCVRIARGRLNTAPINRASRLLYGELESWFQGSGTVRVEVIVQLLRDEGLLRDGLDEELQGD